jgi:hypothetical protein
MVGKLIDGQRQPKPEPMQPLRLLDLHPQPVVFEVDFSEWEEADRWQTTIPMDLSELKGAA